MKIGEQAEDLTNLTAIRSQKIAENRAGYCTTSTGVHSPGMVGMEPKPCQAAALTTRDCLKFC